MNANDYFNGFHHKLEAENSEPPPPHIDGKFIPGFRLQRQRSPQFSIDFLRTGRRGRWKFEGHCEDHPSRLGISESSARPLALKARPKNNQPYIHERGNFLTSSIRSKNSFQYGYVEALVKMGDPSEVSSSFCLREIPFPSKALKTDVGKSERKIKIFDYGTSTEDLIGITIEELYQTSLSYKPNVEQEDCVQAHKSMGMERNLSTQKFIKVGLLWTDKQICWYLNDVLFREENVGGTSDANRRGHMENFCGEGAPNLHIQFHRSLLHRFQDQKNDDEMNSKDDYNIYYIRTWLL